MNILKKTLLVAGLGATLGFGVSAHANIVDLFDDPLSKDNDRVVDTSLGAGGCATGSTAGAVASGNGCFYQYNGTNILGGYRDLFVVINALQAGADARASLAAGAGSLAFGNNPGTNGSGVVQWDGNDNSPVLNHNLLNVDLINQTGCGPTGCIEFVASVIIADLGFNYSITVVDTAGHTSTLDSASINAVPPTEDAVYLFEWFSRADGCYVDLGLPFCITHSGTPGAVDFHHVGGLELAINNPTSNVGVPQTFNVDLALASITKQSVPEPGTLALAGLALMGMAGLRRRRNS